MPTLVSLSFFDSSLPMLNQMPLSPRCPAHTVDAPSYIEKVNTSPDGSGGLYHESNHQIVVPRVRKIAIDLDVQVKRLVIVLQTSWNSRASQSTTAS
jgi:hypothetical protein